ncbi:MAG: isoaspartyl peptidase/L-asparaginase [Trueperaceae bacterium]|nr:isoaspartyl peptidase/L-asparaginase [Trueperaceae bacterium]
MPKLLIHGGAGTIAEVRRPAYRDGLSEALAAGWAAFDEGADAVEAVLRAVVAMEANGEAFNAGVGGSPNRDGEVELDACIVRGEDGSAGAVAAVRTAPSAIRLADLVRRTTPHVLLVGAGADALVTDPVDPASLLTPYTRAQWDRWRAGREGADAAPAATGPTPTGSATVGAVALDAHGDLAAATSTGGVLAKWPGRVGDAPIVGAGTYADRAVAVSATGKGEAFLRAVTAKALADRLERADPLDAALRRALADVRRMDGSGGLIVATADGRLAYAFDTPHLAMGWTDGARTVADVLEGGAGATVVVADATRALG